MTRPPVRPTSRPAGPAGPAGAGSALVTADWVAARRAEPGVVLVEVDAEPAHHHLAHVPGATFVDWQDAVAGLLTHGAPGRRAFEALMGSRGISPDDEVVLYGDAGSRYAAAVFWLMRHHGHRGLRLLDGGRAAWVARGGTLTDAETRRPATRYTVTAGCATVRATRDDVLSRVAGGDGATLLDCRSPDEFAGHGVRAPDSPGLRGCAPGAATGHVPGARNLPAAALLRPDGRLKARVDLARVAAAAGVSMDRAVLTYCHRSERSCLAWFALSEVLGHPDVRVYDGGWQEYGNLAGVLVSRVAEPAAPVADDGGARQGRANGRQHPEHAPPPS